ncbi:MAG: multicopper oxidase domain-containing protein [Nitrosopumilaceae archaeon]|jgi:nitrite reductase (NO-forming)|nr:multicopper oxidase domain-containing protein [Nitrosopumilaceae archaeon]MBA4458386.1 multicopper oxidase domain-containing protein [Nitrosopumilaceae archaeon]RMW34300.1 MAG: hypothetical protein EA443_05640 [Nitrosopumilus sp.]
MTENQFYLTTPARTGKMMAIMLGICVVGGAIFFSLWDYWISEPAPVVAMMAGSSDVAAPAAQTGKTITSDLSFLESADFRSLTFNAMIDEPGVNPTIEMNVGDKVIFNVVNDGKSFHAFGVTKDTEGFGGIIPGSEVASASNPLKAGESGTSEFIAGEEGTYYYICTVPGHREQGMVGEIIVGPAQGGGSSGVAAAPTGVSHDFTLDFVESDDFRTLAFNALPGEDGNNPEIRVNSGDEVTISSANNGKSFHAFGVTATPEDFNNVLWGSEIAAATNPLKPGESGSTTFTAGAPGTYYYICTVPGHALQGMVGNFIVE